MSGLLLEAPTSYFRNSSRAYDTGAPPDRFTAIPGVGNYRGAKIKTLQQMSQLKDEYGIKTIVNLARDSMYEQDCEGGGECEPQWANQLGLRYIYIPLGSSPPTETEWLEIKKALIDGHTYIHCTHGVDRTGAVGGRWVREVLGLPNDQLLDYTHTFGGQWRSEGDPNRKLREWMLAGQHDPELAGQLKPFPVWIPLAAGGTALVAALIYRMR